MRSSWLFLTVLLVLRTANAESDASSEDEDLDRFDEEEEIIDDHKVKRAGGPINFNGRPPPPPMFSPQFLREPNFGPNGFPVNSFGGNNPLPPHMIRGGEFGGNRGPPFQGSPSNSNFRPMGQASFHQPSFSQGPMFSDALKSPGPGDTLTGKEPNHFKLVPIQLPEALKSSLPLQNSEPKPNGPMAQGNSAVLDTPFKAIAVAPVKILSDITNSDAFKNIASENPENQQPSDLAFRTVPFNMETALRSGPPPPFRPSPSSSGNFNGPFAESFSSNQSPPAEMIKNAPSEMSQKERPQEMKLVPFMMPTSAFRNPGRFVSQQQMSSSGGGRPTMGFNTVFRNAPTSANSDFVDEDLDGMHSQPRPFSVGGSNAFFQQNQFQIPFKAAVSFQNQPSPFSQQNSFTSMRNAFQQQQQQQQQQLQQQQQSGSNFQEDFQTSMRNPSSLQQSSSSSSFQTASSPLRFASSQQSVNIPQSFFQPSSSSSFGSNANFQPIFVAPIKILSNGGSSSDSESFNDQKETQAVLSGTNLRLSPSSFNNMQQGSFRSQSIDHSPSESSSSFSSSSPELPFRPIVLRPIKIVTSVSKSSSTKSSPGTQSEKSSDFAAEASDNIAVASKEPFSFSDQDFDESESRSKSHTLEHYDSHSQSYPASQYSFSYSVAIPGKSHRAKSKEYTQYSSSSSNKKPIYIISPSSYKSSTARQSSKPVYKIVALRPAYSTQRKEKSQTYSDNQNEDTVAEQESYSGGSSFGRSHAKPIYQDNASAESHQESYVVAPVRHSSDYFDEDNTGSYSKNEHFESDRLQNKQNFRPGTSNYRFEMRPHV